MTVTAGEKYKHVEPAWAKTIGQGPPPTCVTIRKTLADGTEEVRKIPFGCVVKASANCDPDAEIANMDAPTPLVRTQIVEGMTQQFEHVPA